jgi:DNA-binding response OmpR family regulator
MKSLLKPKLTDKSKMPKIIIVEDDPAIAEMLVYHLQDLGYETDHFDNGLKAKEYLIDSMTTDYDLVVLDIMLPGYNGLDLCKELRNLHPTTPIMMLTSLDSEVDRVIGLELGADDYLTKPFSMRECQARIKALLRRCELNNNSITEDALANAQQEISFEELSISSKSRRVLLDRKTIELTAREFDLLFYLAQNQQEVYSRSQLLDAVWGYAHDGYEHTVNTHINRLRKKLKRSNDKPDFIQTVWAVGYKFLNDEDII